MSQFTTPLESKRVGINRHEILTDFSYHIGSYPRGVMITVPAGFQTDFASVPRPFWGLFPPDGVYTKAAVIHDYLYDTRITSRLVADAIFLEAMGVLGVGHAQRLMIFAAVRCFGWRHWSIQEQVLITRSELLKHAVSWARRRLWPF